MPPFYTRHPHSNKSKTTQHGLPTMYRICISCSPLLNTKHLQNGQIPYQANKLPHKHSQHLHSLLRETFAMKTYSLLPRHATTLSVELTQTLNGPWKKHFMIHTHSIDTTFPLRIFTPSHDLVPYEIQYFKNKCTTSSHNHLPTCHLLHTKPYHVHT